tara:strand:- start:537 stop:1187 length:651 start_codon:yes stop_codon:yes gene_type:complete
MIMTGLKKRIYTSTVLFLLIYLIIKYDPILVFSLIVLGVLSLLEFFSLTKKLFKHFLINSIINFLFILYISIFCYLFLFFSNFLQLKILLFSLLFCCIASDIGGFVLGRLLKGPKLTKISPNKTYSGAIGSILLSSLVFSTLIFYFTQNLNFKIIIIAIITSLACQIGDLFFSFLKRKGKIKDTGNILPGHGGVLDRLDGIFFGIPIGFIFMVLIY